MTDIYWFQTDLRLRDNPGLMAHAQAGQLLLVYFWPESRPWCNVTGMGAQRRRFLVESLTSLRTELQVLGQDLLILPGPPAAQLPRLARELNVARVGTSLSPGYYERKAREEVASRLPCELLVHPGNTLFDGGQFPFSEATMPAQFTPFRKAVAGLQPLAPIAAPTSLPRPPGSISYAESPAAECQPHLAFAVRGGAGAGERRLRQFLFEEQSVVTYKATRNGLDGLNGTSSLSPWLALGSLGVREIAAALQDFEKSVCANESTGWLLFELLWREFFHWRALADDVGLFRVGGKAKKLRRCTFEPRNFARWCQGDTNYPLVNALMRQLVACGWMSNRGRQIAASCLVHECGIEWRYGAAFFEKHLIDYDVASNYGNWQYLAGVGADPRGGRHFNLEKQAAEHDPGGVFTGKWGGERPYQPDHVVDAADWPLL